MPFILELTTKEIEDLEVITRSRIETCQDILSEDNGFIRRPYRSEIIRLKKLHLKIVESLKEEK